MVSEARAREIAGNHVDQVGGGPQTGYSVSDSTKYGPGGPYEVTIEVWRGPDERADPDEYVVDVDEDGTITDAVWSA